MRDIRLSRFAGAASMLVGAGFVVFIVLALMGRERLFHGVLAVASLLAFAAVIGIGRSVAGGHPGWVLWGSSLGLFGLAVSAIVQTSLILGVERQELRPESVLVIATVAAWVLITSLAALVVPHWATAWSWAGVALSLMWAGLIPAQQLGVRAAGLVLGGGATVLAAIWFTWAGAILRGEGETSAAIDQGADDGSGG